MENVSADSHVWYVAYGSNLYSERFMCYIEGGTPFGSKRADLGSEDHAQPLDERAVFLPHRLYFSGRSRRWNGGVAYIDTIEDDTVMTYSRAWLISRQQFCDLVRQENGEPDLEIDLDAAIAAGSLEVRDRGYGHLMSLGERDGLPMLTFTSPLPLAERRPSKPSTEYLGVIATGLRECYGLNVVGLRNYLNACPGIDNSLSYGQGDKLLHAALVELGMIEDKPQKNGGGKKSSGKKKTGGSKN